MHHYDQPTNGTSFIRFKVNSKKVPKSLKDYLDIYKEILPKLGTQSTDYETFQNKFHTFSTGLSLSIDHYADRKEEGKYFENMVYEFSFIDRNLDKAIDLLDELVSRKL